MAPVRILCSASQPRFSIRRSAGISQNGRRARYYTLTPPGEKALAAEHTRWTRYVEALAKLEAEQA